MTSSGLLVLALAVQVLGVDQSLTVPYEKYTLPENGLEVILSEDHTLPIVAVNVWYHVGPLNEAVHRTGFAHLFEHLMFQGSGHVGDDQHFKLLESRGASLINGTTDYDRTNYFETVPSNELELALWLESDRMGFLLDTLDAAKLNNQRDVVMNERRQSIENVPYGPSSEKLVQTVFLPNHPYYGYVMGSMEDLAKASLQDVREFYTRYYAPSNATVVIAGDFNSAGAKSLVQKYFATLPRRSTPKTPPISTAPIDKPRTVEVHEPVTLPRVSMAWLSPAAYAPGDADADVLATILGGGKTSRLYTRLVYDLQIAQNVAVNQESLALVSTFNVTVTAKPGVDATRLQREVDKILEAARHSKPSDQEVQRARNVLMTRMVAQLQSIGGFGGKADMLNRYNQYVHDPGYLAHDIARYNQVTPNTVATLAKTLLDPQHRAVVVTLPKT